MACNCPPPIQLTEEEARRYGYDPARSGPRQSDPLPPDTDDYVFTEFQWPNRPGRTFTWSNWSGDLGENRTDGNGRDDILDEGFSAAQLVTFRQQIVKWEAILDVNFSEVADSTSNNIRIGISNTARTGLAGVQPYAVGDVTTAMCLYYDETDGASTNVAILSGVIALHELGHVLGLGHCPNQSNIMRATYLGSMPAVLQPGDINGGRHLYGPDAVTTDTDPIYIHGLSVPPIPTGGSLIEDHTPSGWDRTELLPTLTENVYRSQRTRSYTNGMFTSATAWEAVTLYSSPIPPTIINLGTLSAGADIIRTGSVTDISEDIYTFAINSSQPITLDLYNLTDDLDLEIQDATESSLDTSEAAGTADENITYDASSGSYRVVVRPYFDAVSSYSLRVRVGTISQNVSPTVSVTTPDQDVSGGDTVQLNSSSSDEDGTIASGIWTGSGTFTNASLDNTSWTAPAAQTTDQEYVLRRTATDNDGATGSDTVTITVRALALGDVAPSFTDNTGDEITGTVGTAIASVTVPAASGTPTPTYAVQGSLPAGLAFNTSTRVLSGTPTAAGSGTITIRATNSEGFDDWSTLR